MRSFLILLLVLVTAFCLAVFWQLPKSQARLVVFNVGQGDSIYLQTPQGQRVLIDGGPGNTVLSKLSQQMPFFDRRLDMVVLTHPHQDHVAGLAEVLKYYQVGKVLFTGTAYDSLTYLALLNELEEMHIPVEVAWAGRDYNFGDGYLLDIIYPLAENELVNAREQNLNNTSIVAKLLTPDKTVLLAADMEKDVEAKLIDQQVSLTASYLKVGHHGGDTSSRPGFLEMVKPEFGYISVGVNDYGHPHQEVLDRLDSFGVDVRRTDLAGDLVVW